MSLALTFHGCLQGIDGINLSDDDSGSKAPQGLGTAFAHIPITCHHSYFASNHDICSTLDAIDEGLSAAIQVIKLALGKAKEEFQNTSKPLKQKKMSLEKQQRLLCKCCKPGGCQAAEQLNHSEGWENDHLL